MNKDVKISPFHESLDITVLSSLRARHVKVKSFDVSAFVALDLREMHDMRDWNTVFLNYKLML